MLHLRSARAGTERDGRGALIQIVSFFKRVSLHVGCFPMGSACSRFILVGFHDHDGSTEIPFGFLCEMLGCRDSSFGGV
jgi:hypothetical protein